MTVWLCEPKKTIDCVLCEDTIAPEISCIVRIKKLWYFLTDVCKSLRSLRHLLIIKYGGTAYHAKFVYNPSCDCYCYSVFITRPRLPVILQWHMVTPVHALWTDPACPLAYYAAAHSTQSAWGCLLFVWSVSSLKTKQTHVEQNTNITTSCTRVKFNQTWTYLGKKSKFKVQLKVAGVLVNFVTLLTFWFLKRKKEEVWADKRMPLK